jgi:hypothetical protein
LGLCNLPKTEVPREKGVPVDAFYVVHMNVVSSNLIGMSKTFPEGVSARKMTRYIRLRHPGEAGPLGIAVVESFMGVLSPVSVRRVKRSKKDVDLCRRGV